MRAGPIISFTSCRRDPRLDQGLLQIKLELPIKNSVLAHAAYHTLSLLGVYSVPPIAQPFMEMDSPDKQAIVSYALQFTRTLLEYSEFGRSLLFAHNH